mgnify:CR=1 FL=1
MKSFVFKNGLNTVLYLNIPNMSENVIVPGSDCMRFDLTVESHANNILVELQKKTRESSVQGQETSQIQTVKK